MNILESIKSPRDLKSLSTEELEQLCGEIREYIIECCSENPGHIGASLGAVEIAVAIHKVFNTPDDKVVWDVGHQAYAHKIITGRREGFKNNRKKDGISGFPKISESEYDSFGTGHSSTSISAALGMAVASQMQGRKDHHIAVIGDGAMTGGMAFEGLNHAGSMKTDLLVILNDNNISIDKNTGALHNYLFKVSTSQQYNKIKNNIWNRLGAGRIRDRIQRIVKTLKHGIFKGSETWNLFDALGFRYFGPIDGNNISQMVDTLNRIKSLPGPKLLHVVTTKGKGYKPAETDQTVWHAPGTFDMKTGERTGKKSSVAKYQEVFGQTLLDLAKMDDRIVGITPAMASGCSMNILMKEMPGRAFDVGIAEQHAVTFSAGLAAEGQLPFCNIYSSFSQRAFDQIIHDVALQGLKVVFCFDRGGLVGEDGATHHGVFDMASLRPVPGLTLAAPLNELELRNMMYTATLDKCGPMIIRYPRGNGAGEEWRDADFSEMEIGKGVKLHDGAGTALLSIGAIGNRAKEAVRLAGEKGTNVIHYDMRFIKPVDEEILAEACREAESIITVEDGSVMGGLFSVVSEYIAKNGLHNKVIGMGIPDRFIGQGTPSELYSDCKYNTDDILEVIMETSMGTVTSKREKK